ncbi:MAG TPA: hypothetical protein VJT31_12265 [Rugosimonospora sp.]|nr:hypothetical protein [Rugosimonospora sp.]
MRTNDYGPCEIAQALARSAAAGVATAVAVDRVAPVQSGGRFASFEILMADGQMYRVRVEAV